MCCSYTNMGMTSCSSISSVVDRLTDLTADSLHKSCILPKRGGGGGGCCWRRKEMVKLVSNPHCEYMYVPSSIGVFFLGFKPMVEEECGWVGWYGLYSSNIVPTLVETIT